jgi:flagella basal body P-ring formation protein FlgA
MKIIRFLFICGSLVPVAFGQQASCLPVDGDQITGKDLARALPLLKAIPADTPLAPSPQPGGTRVFHQSELQSIASRFSVHLDVAPDVCFYILTEPLTQARVMQAMHDSLGIPDAVIEITELSTEPAPRGRIEFPRERLGTPALPDKRSPVLWRGFVVYAGERRFAVWANVWITAPVARIVSTESLRQGVPIVASQVRREVTESFPAAVHPDRTIDQVVGLVPLHAISAGSEVRFENLVRPNDVVKGDMVHVEVRMGAARLALNGRAESTGRIGDFIAVLNPESSRTFQARVDGKDRVVVEPGGGN